MALEVGVAAGQVDLAVGTALVTVSCSISPMEVAGQVLKAAQSLQEATIAAGMCEDICKDIQRTTITRLPVVCELLRLGQLFPEAEGAADLNQALLLCFKLVCGSLHEARIAMYTYLQCSTITRLRQAASVEKLMNEKRWQLRNRFDDVNPYMSLATLLRSQQSEEQAQHTAAAVRELQRQLQVRELEDVRTADPARVKAVAKAMLARESVKGQSIKVSKEAVMDVAVSPSGGTFVTASNDNTAAVWDAATGTRMHELRGHSRCVYSVAWSPDGSRVATGSNDDTAAVWDAATGTRMHELRGHSRCVNSVAWSPDGSRVATGSHDNTAAVWDAATGTRVHELRGHSSRVTSVAWSPDGSRVATGSGDNTAAVWDAATGTRVHELRGFSNWVNSVAWSPDGSRVATGSVDGTAAVWDAATGTRMHELRGHRYFVNSVAWSPDGNSALTASNDGTVRIYSLAGRRD